MIVKVDCDGREFIVNMDAVSCIIPNSGYVKRVDGDSNTHLIEIKNGGLYLITKREFHQIAEKIEYEQKTGSRQDV